MHPHMYGCRQAALPRSSMLSLSSVSLGFSAPALAPSQSARADVRMETVADLEALAAKLNPAVGYYNPTPLAEMGFWGQSNEATIGFLRHAEIKHGRVAMAGFVGYCIQANGIFFPWKLTGDLSFADISAAGGPSDQWDALPTGAKLQIIGFVGFLEWWSENKYALSCSGETHYMRGGKPGFFPSFNKGGIPHPVPLELFDPFGLQSKMTAEAKEKSLCAEINNGRLAMIGIMGLVSTSKGAIVPGMNGIGIKEYAGEPMAAFSASDALPFVSDMLKFSI